MSNVTLMIGGRDYTVNCATGEEDHIAELGAMIDGKLTAMGAASQNETRNMLFAALLLADEIFELKAGGAVSVPADDVLDELPYATPDPLPYEAPAVSIDPARLETIARRLENLASHLEG